MRERHLDVLLLCVLAQRTAGTMYKYVLLRLDQYCVHASANAFVR